MEITFVANISSIRTTVDGGLNVTLSLPATDSETIKKLFEAKEKNLHVAMIPEPEYGG